MAMTRDILNLIKNITQNKINTLEENSKIMDLSERSLRYKIDDCNYHLNILKLPELNIKKGIITFSSTLDTVVEKINENIYLYSFSQDEREKIVQEEGWTLLTDIGRQWTPPVNNESQDEE